MKQFLLWEQLRGIQYNRAVMPEDAIHSKLRLIVGADAAEPVLKIDNWAGFEKVNGTWSCQLLLACFLLLKMEQFPRKNSLLTLLEAIWPGWSGTL